eukprot:85126-Pleurochrysis_carterae.AAC.3
MSISPTSSAAKEGSSYTHTPSVMPRSGKMCHASHRSGCFVSKSRSHGYATSGASDLVTTNVPMPMWLIASIELVSIA